MKPAKWLAPVPLPAGHRDLPIIHEIESELLKRAGGRDKIVYDVPRLIQRAIDKILDTPLTGRLSVNALTKNEKTHIGTIVEILLRDYFGFEKGKLDLLIKGRDVDIKNTTLDTWMIPKEAIDHPCILVASEDAWQSCFLGIFIARKANLTDINNQDKKFSVSAQGFKNIHWIFDNVPFPENVLRKLGPKNFQIIMSQIGANKRVSELFRRAMLTPIAPHIIQSVAQTDDYMRRVRKGGGARDQLSHEGVAVLNGKFDRGLIETLGLSPIANGEYIAFKPTDPQHIELLRSESKID